jgi:hypothetical protein
MYRTFCAQALRERFPHVDVDIVQMRDLSPPEQLDELARTSVLISNLGSKSFRLVMLPDGAQACIRAPRRSAPCCAVLLRAARHESNMLQNLLSLFGVQARAAHSLTARVGDGHVITFWSLICATVPYSHIFFCRHGAISMLKGCAASNVQVVLVDTKHTLITKEQRELHRFESAWGEVDNCWGQLGYVSFIVYEPPEDTDLVLHPTPPRAADAPPDKVSPEFLKYRLERNADVVVRAKELGDLVAVALGNAAMAYVSSSLSP